MGRFGIYPTTMIKQELCSAKYQESSLNGEPLQRADLTNTLVGVLTRSRRCPVALVADIKNMFYQV